ncbi:MAG: hypothetical protein M3R59_03205 [Verrucomicrobiota bacterium]|nr:hypothetical protein [Verrucomicrobiota bacterium]
MNGELLGGFDPIMASSVSISQGSRSSGTLDGGLQSAGLITHGLDELGKKMDKYWGDN